MAMKLNPAEKSNDSILRAYNSQIEKAYKQLGATHTTTRNLINKANSIFGANMRTAKTVYGDIPQIQRNRTTVSNANAVKALQKETRYKSGTTKAGQILPMYDVSRAYQNAIKNVQKQLLKNIPAKTRMGMSAKQLQKELNRMTTASAINDKITENDLASEIWEKYKETKDNGENISQYLDFAKIFHTEGQEKALQKYTLESLTQRRNDALMEKALDDPTLLNAVSGQQIEQFLSGFEDLNPF